MDPAPALYLDLDLDRAADLAFDKDPDLTLRGIKIYIHIAVFL